MKGMRTSLKTYFWKNICLIKLRIGWILYNLLYIHILRSVYSNEVFQYISYNDYYELSMRYLCKMQGLDYRKIKEDMKES